MLTARFDSHDPRDPWNVRLAGPVATHTAYRLDDVMPALEQAEAATRDGRWVAMVVAYDAAPAFEPVLAGRMAAPVTDLPLVWAGVFEASSTVQARSSKLQGGNGEHGGFWPGVEREVFVERARRAQEYIRAGDTYQVNLTFPMAGTGHPDYDAVRQTQQARYCAHLDIGSHEIFSFSPELFFERIGNRLTTRPMKGTAPRGRWLAEDESMAARLARSPKERAENVMIVDMLRNDVGRIAMPGSVQVPRLFTAERYPTLWQLTSTVEGTLASGVTLAGIFRALFPCGSVTGAPKIRTMEIIAELEGQPRGVYTGAIGLLRPGGDCTFNVAIRTVVVEKQSGRATMGVGAGVTADSDPDAEYDESLLKAQFLGRRAVDHRRLTVGGGRWTEGSERTARAGEHPAVGRESRPSGQDLASAEDFSLLETMRLDNGVLHRIERHLRRMRDSATYFGFAWNEAKVREALTTSAAAHPAGVWRCRLLVDRQGDPTIECTPHQDEARTWHVAFADESVDSSDPFLFNKTTNRTAYDFARRRRPDVDDVLLWNERGEVTESTIANVVVERNGVRLTPPVTSGLLAGVFRGELLEQGQIQEATLTRGQVARADRVWLVNSLRGWVEVSVVR